MSKLAFALIDKGVGCSPLAMIGRAITIVVVPGIKDPLGTQILEVEPIDPGADPEETQMPVDISCL